MNNKSNSVGQALIVIALLICCISCSKNSPTPAPGKDPKVTSVDKNYVINGELITIRGVNFSANSDSVSQIIATNVADTSSIYLNILSRNASQIVAVMTGTNGGVLGTYYLSYYSKSDTADAIIYPSIVYINVVAPATGQFNVSSNFIENNLTPGSIAAFGAKNGSLDFSTYSVELLKYDFLTGDSTQYIAQVDSVNATKFDGLMDKVSFTVPNAPAGNYTVKVKYSKSSLAAGWNSVFTVQ